MNDEAMVKDVQDIIDERKLDARIIWHEQCGQTSADAARALGVDPEQIVKSLMLFDEKEEHFMAVIPGTRRADMHKLAQLRGSPVRMADPASVLAITGHPVGGLPPIGTPMATFVDTEVIDRDVVYASAGSPYAGLEIRPRDIVDVARARVADIVER